MTTKDSAPESEEQKYRLKCKDLKRRIDEVDQSNELVTLAINRTKSSIRRLRLEYSILLERLETNSVSFPDTLEEMSPPPSPSLDLNEKAKSGNKRPKKSTAPKGTLKNRIRDPNLPKRPTNAYLIFCESEKERIKNETGDSSLSSVHDLGKNLVEAWKNLDEEARKPYHKIFEDEKARYRREMIAYSLKNSDPLDATRADTEGEIDLDGEAEVEGNEDNDLDNENDQTNIINEDDNATIRDTTRSAAKINTRIEIRAKY
ncbi:HMG-box [Yamadazyma tenuis ATCC 10573]|uniref:HMG-box n=1 Tax=Candida tenuis (strain ATCC 10573 / BCRC 21748 / CBS 615 / JCM 9827 / NBRC 10315 / NRRL Y-1498 / VKM Y-70) TaxID=590646 RepID=G3B9Q3_CANTC|nr:HMG-box [Yamadazyma tenuis ATCC 10573]EGV61944.1 HMG-box [Yamadazyma tenuis ATCC 10573]